jgi:branched-chain amino acid transport system ATP-binding protein
VHDISFEVRPGESVGLVGPNGAGKTTLFNCVCGQLRNDEGDIMFDGASLLGVPTFKRARLGIGRTYQKVEVFTDMSVRDHLMVAERSRRGEGRLWKDLLNMSTVTKDESDRVDATLELVGISSLAETSVNALGLGNCRLVELARALAAEPKILLADEPSSGLDIHETAEVAAVLRTVQRERDTAILLVEHDLSMVGEVVDRTVVMDLGSMLCEGTFDEVMANPDVRHAYLGQMGAA